MVNQGRWTVDIDGDFVVFIIGAKVRNPIRGWRALPLLAKMPFMLKELEKDPSAGLLAYQQHGRPFGVIVQYWRSFEALEGYASNPDAIHAGVWREWFRRAQHKNTATSIWHETFKVRAGEYEALYQNIAPIGLAKAGTPTPANRRGETARERITASG